MNNQMWMDHSVMQLNTEPGAQKIEFFVSQGLGCLDLQFTDGAPPSVKVRSLQSPCGSAACQHTTTVISQAATVKQNERSTEASLKDYENPASCTWGSRKRLKYGSETFIAIKIFCCHDFQF